MTKNEEISLLCKIAGVKYFKKYQSELYKNGRIHPFYGLSDEMIFRILCMKIIRDKKNEE